MKAYLLKVRRPLVWLGLAMVYVWPLVSLRGAMDMFLKVDGVVGESEDKVHKLENDILSWSWGMSNTGSFHNGGGGSSRTPTARDITITKYIDRSSPTLMFKLFSGQEIPAAQVTVRRTVNSIATDYMVLKLEPVIITSYTTGGTKAEDRLTESITLNFGKMDVSYREIDSAGNPGATFETAVDFQALPK